MKTGSFIFLGAALLAVAFAVVAGLWGGSYACLGISTIIATKTVPSEVVSVVTLTNSFVRFGLFTAAGCAALSGLLAWAGHNYEPSARG
jgi:hypothetical protein